jgi:hypothetical protein
VGARSKDFFGMLLAATALLLLVSSTGVFSRRRHQIVLVSIPSPLFFARNHSLASPH